MKRKNGLDRRNFISALAAGGAASLMPKPSFSSEVKAYRGERRRRAVTMWDFSWLTRRTAPESEYADFDRVLDELAARGYDCVRADAFPHLIAAGPDGAVVDQFTALPQAPAFMWGNHHETTINPRRDLPVFMRALRERGMTAGLSSWFTHDSSGRFQMVRSPTDFARVWSETLALLAEEDVLDVIEWVDFCNEFPLTIWAPGAVEYMSEQAGQALPPMPELHTKKHKQVMGDFMRESIAPVKEKFPELPYCFSFTSASSKILDGVDVSIFDVMEPHFWLAHNLGFSLATGLFLPVLYMDGETSHIIDDNVIFHYHAFRKKWVRSMEKMMDDWAGFSARHRLPLYTSESWGPINWSDQPERSDEWDWVKDIAEQCCQMAVQKNWTGVCTSNFCGPQHRGMWEDVEFHQKMTDIIL